MYRQQTVALIVPVLDEAENIAQWLPQVDRTLVDEVIVADNGSTDESVDVARRLGATAVIEPRRGYGSACLRGIAATGAEILVFMDGDGSDDPSDLAAVVEALDNPGIELVVGSRVLGDADPGALTPVQRFGNALTCELVRLFWGVRYTDLGPFRAIRRRALETLEMADPDFGWTIEMQVKAAQRGLGVVEIPVRRKRRHAGTSKVSGNLYGSYMAGRRILGYVFGAFLEDRCPSSPLATFFGAKTPRRETSAPNKTP
ncbi:MAG: glycosyltransferase [Myxococcales bacterium]|nr:glycosyltransferase [Myxococcales bacterium]